MKPAVVGTSLMLVVSALLGCSSHSKVILRPETYQPKTELANLVCQVDALGDVSREALLKERLLAGYVPKFLRRFSRIDVSIKADNGKLIKAQYYVSPDYLSIS
ncbi:hypothetical protein [Parapedobacter tibetensis]|uniref:hypothetical protein n=1 Tax=Parapedobacter tibetensis TaxID=2972951 RepID=UPI00214D174B|nr:hypothetical protein [Parapedobacter tibetensis]